MSGLVCGLVGAWMGGWVVEWMDGGMNKLWCMRQ